jgi:hypothetical protein
VSSMQQSKSLAVMFLLGAFLAGGALGFVADRAVTKRPYVRQFEPRDMRAEFANALRLSEAQQRSIDSIFDWRGAREKEIRKLYKPAVDSILALHKPSLDSILDSSRVLINARLDTTQQRLFKELRDNMKAREDSIRKARASRQGSRDGSHEGKQR